jgi:signal transduction histidine kinase/Flp pilus assembly protein TadD
MPFFILLTILTVGYPQTQVNDRKSSFYAQKGAEQISAGLVICDSLQDDPERLLVFSKELLALAGRSVPKSQLMARVEKAVSDAYFFLDSIELSNSHLITAIEIAENQQAVDSVFLVSAYNDVGMNYNEIEQFQPATDYLNKAIQLSRRLGLLDDLSTALSNLASVHFGKGQFQEAIALFSETYQIDLKTGNRENQASSLNSLGRMYVEWGKYQSGLEYYQRSIALLDTVAQRDVLAIRYNNVGMVHQLMGNHDEAIRYLNKAMAIDVDEGNFLKISQRHFNLGNSYMALNDFDKARQSFEKAESFFVRTKMYAKLSKVYCSLGQLYAKQGNRAKAEEILLKGRDMAEMGETLPERTQLYAALYQFYKNGGNFGKALTFLEQKTVAEDSIFNLKASEKIEELEAGYQNEKKEAEIIRLESENKVRLKEISFRKRERNWAFAGISVLFLFLGGLYFLFATVKKQKGTLELQNQELDRLNQTQNRLFGIISHDLRNVAAAYLASARIIEYNLNKGQPEKLMPVAAEISNNAKNLSAMLDSLLQWAVIQIKGIRPEKKELVVKDELDMVLTLVKEAAENKSNNIQITGSHETIWCDPESFRLIVRNLIGNAIKFTSNGTISIRSAGSHGVTTIEISDTGCGIAEDDLQNLFIIGKGKSRPGTAREKGTGLGLLMVAEHIEKNDGSIRADSLENQGTTFTITFPSKKP